MRVLLADDHELFRAGIASLIGAWGFEVVGTAGNGLEALEQARRLEPDLVLMDVQMPVCNGLEATRLIKAELPETRIVIVTVSDDDESLFEAIKSGAVGYLLKGMSEEDLSKTLAAVVSGEPALSPTLAGKILDEFVRLSSGGVASGDSPGLTPRELEVLRLVAEGATNKEIAAALYVTENTISFHMKHILAKLHLKNRAAAAAYAVRSGLVKPDGAADAAE